MVNMKISTRRWSANLVFLLIYSGFHWQFVNAFTDTILQGQSFITSLIRENDLILHKICYIPIRFHKIRKYSCKYMQICFQYLYFKPFLFYRITLLLFILYSKSYGESNDSPLSGVLEYLRCSILRGYKKGEYQLMILDPHIMPMVMDQILSQYHSTDLVHTIQSFGIYLH